MKHVTIVPAILVTSLTQFKNRIKKFDKHFSLAQIDILDNTFVKNKTYTNLDRIKGVRTSLKYEVHLMTTTPRKYIKKWGTFSKVKRIIIHYEAVESEALTPLLTLIKKYGKKAGIALNPDTPTSAIYPWLKKTDYVLVMGVQPGWSGHKFERGTYNKLRALHRQAPKLALGVDGGVSPDNAVKLVNAGASFLNSGSFLTQSENIKKAKLQLASK